MTKFARSPAILAITVGQQHALVELTNEPKMVWIDFGAFADSSLAEVNETYVLYLDKGSKGSVSFRRIGEDSRGSILWTIERSSQEIGVDTV